MTPAGHVSKPAGSFLKSMPQVVGEVRAYANNGITFIQCRKISK